MLTQFLLGFKSEKLKNLIKSKGDKEGSSNNSASGSSDSSTSKKPGHGRKGTEQYQAEKIVVEIDNLKAGDPCPEENCDGKLYAIKPATVVRLTADGLVKATSYVLNGLRCALCGKTFRAPLPETAGVEKYSKEAISWLSFYKYYAGLPFKRIETIQNLSGVPIADATQWSLMCNLKSDIIPVYNQLMLLTSDANLIHADDTKCQILELDTDHDKRKAQYTTVIVSKFEGHTIYLFVSGQYYAGKNVSKILSTRTSDKTLIYMADAHSMNNLHNLSQGIVSKTIIIYCLVHARRQFVNILEIFCEEAQYVLKLIAKVYEHEEHCKSWNFNDEQRLEYHQKYSISILDEWKAWLHKQLDGKLTEPNSSLGQAIRYVLKRWHQLTEFTRVAGCPLDNNIVEQALRIPIRLRKSAYFYKTTNGALVGDSVMSLIYTCIAADQSPIEYCTALQKNALAVKTNPSQWLPWNFKAQLVQDQLNVAA